MRCIVASLLFRALGISPGAVPIAWVINSSTGAILAILAHCMYWRAHISRYALQSVE